MTSTFKKLLLTGTALVAISASATQAQAAVGHTSATTETLGAAATGGNGLTQAAPTVGEVGLVFGAGNITVTAPLADTISGGSGGVDTDAGAASPGQVGGAAVDFAAQHGTSSSVLTALVNNTVVTGGAGGAGAVGAASAGSVGGNGAAGVLQSANFSSVSGTGSVTGGAGGNGGAGNGGANNGGAAGAGGNGFTTAGNSAVFSQTGAVVGGAGGTGGLAATVGTGGAGGAGGIGYNLTGNTGTLTITGNVTGGAGGLGGSAVGAGTGGAGGAGGTGIVAAGTGETISIGAASTVTGGAGAAIVTPGGGTPGAVGADGTGILLSGTTTLLTNAGIIKGGASAAGSKALSVTGNATTITNTGTIGNGAAHAGNALDVSGATVVTTFTNSGAASTVAVTSGNAVNVGVGSTITSLTNTAGTISATTGKAVNIAGVVTTLTNTGTISATTGSALNIAAGGVLTTLTNTGGTITSANVAGPGAGTVNIGSVAQTALTLNGTIVNTAANVVSEAVAITAAPLGTITNAGTIRSDGGGAANSGLGVAVEFAANGTLANSATGVIYGQIIDTGARTVTLTNASGGAITGNILLNGGNVITIGNTGTITGNVTTGAGIDALTLSGGSIVGITDLAAAANTVSVDGTFTTGGNFLATGGTLATTVTGTGTLTVGGANTYNGGAGALTVAASGKFNASGTSVVTSTGNFGNSGTVTLSGTSATTVGAMTNEATGIINLTGGTLTGTTMANKGVINLTSSNLTAAGAYDNGSAGTAGALTIGAGRTLTALSFASSNASTLSLGITDTTTFAKIAATGGGVSLTNVTSSATLTSADAYLPTSTVIGAAGALAPIKIASGTAAATVVNGTVVTETSTLLSLAAYRGDDVADLGGGGSINDIYLKVTRAGLATIGNTTNNDSVSTVLDSAAVTGSASANLVAIEGNLAAATSAAAVNEILESVQPTVDGGAYNATLDFSGQVAGLTDTRLASLRTGGTGVAAGSSPEGMSAWLQAFGQTANQDTRGGINGYDSDTWGGAIGADTAGLMNDSVVGLAISYGLTSVDSQNANTTSTDVNSYGISLYGSTNVTPEVFLNGQIGYAWNDIESDRHNVGGIPGVTANADYHSNQYSAKATLGSDYPVEGGLTVTPTVSAAYTYLDTDSYTETGAGGANLHVDSDSVSLLDLGVGIDAGWKFKASNDGDILKPSLHAGYAYDAIGDRVQTTANFTGAGAAFATQGFDPARSRGDFGAKIVLETVENWDLTAAYNYEVKSDFDAHSGWLRAGTKF